MADKTIYLSGVLSVFPEPFATELRVLCRDPQDAQLVNTVIRFASNGNPPDGVVFIRGENWGALQDTLRASLAGLRPHQPVEQYYEALKASLPVHYQPQLRLLRSLNPHAVSSFVSFVTGGPTPLQPVSVALQLWLVNQLVFTRWVLHVHSRLAHTAMPDGNVKVGAAIYLHTNHGDAGEADVAVTTDRVSGVPPSIGSATSS
jgi:hypothetical protein